MTIQEKIKFIESESGGWIADLALQRFLESKKINNKQYYKLLPLSYGWFTNVQDTIILGERAKEGMLFINLLYKILTITTLLFETRKFLDNSQILRLYKLIPSSLEENLDTPNEILFINLLYSQLKKKNLI